MIPILFYLFNNNTSNKKNSFKYFKNYTKNTKIKIKKLSVDFKVNRFSVITITLRHFYCFFVHHLYDDRLYGNPFSVPTYYFSIEVDRVFFSSLGDALKF